MAYICIWVDDMYACVVCVCLHMYVYVHVPMICLYVYMCVYVPMMCMYVDV
jgi:hypothetical protein